MKINRIVPNCMFEDGVASEIYVTGCKHFCKGCYEPALWNFDNGEILTNDEIVVRANKFNPNAYVLLGGDPLYSPEGVSSLVDRLKQENIPIWLLTGFTREEVRENPSFEEIFQKCDVVKTGKYDATKKQPGFPASSNQKIWRNT